MKRVPKESSIEFKRQPEKNQHKVNVNSKQSNRRLTLPSVNKLSQQKIPEKPQQPYKQEENYIDQALGNLFHQYFIKNGYMKTLQCFQKQQSQGSDNRQQPEEFKRLLLQNFDKGDKDNFFRIFNKYTPLHIRMKDQRTTKLQFYLNIYFLIFKVHPSNISNPTQKKNVIDTQSRQSFQKYLDNKGQVLAKTSQFLPYYALPYIKPFQNPQFKQLFSQDWIDQLRQKVINFVDCLYPSQIPLLCQIYEEYVQRSIKDPIQNSSLGAGAGLVARKNEEIQQLHKKNEEMQIYLQTLAGKYWQFQNNFKKFGENTKNTLVQSQKKWFQLTQQIFYMAATSFEIADSRQSQYPEQTNRQLKRIKQKILKYQGFINTNIDDLINQDVDLSMFQKPSVSMQNQIIHEPESHANTFISLDIKKIKQVFLTQNNDEIVALMKALKHRINVAQGIYLKRQIVVQLCFFDIFGAKQQGQPLLKKLLLNDIRVREQLVKLVSALANDYYGRTYLYDAMGLLMQLMMKEIGDTVVRRCLIVTFQFLSVRIKGQLLMMHNGLIKWMINIIKNQRQTLSEQNLEYLTSLLMNFSFTKEGLDQCEQIRDQLMMNLIQLLQHKNKDIQSYINGTLYRVLSRKSFRQKAHEHGLLDIIDYQINNGASVDTTQLNHVKVMLSLQQQQNLPDETEIQDLEDEDIDDIDNQPLIMNHIINQQQQNEETNQQRILLESYTIAGPEIIEHIKIISKEVDDSLKRRQAQFIRIQMNSQDRPRSVMRPLLRNRSNLSSNLANSVSNRMLPSELRQRVRPYVEGQQQQVPVSPMSGQSSLHNSQIPKPIRQYQNHPQYSQLFQPRNQIVRTPPHSNM